MCTLIWTTAGLAERARFSMAALKSDRDFGGGGEFAPLCAATGPRVHNTTIAPRITVRIMSPLYRGPTGFTTQDARMVNG